MDKIKEHGVYLKEHGEYLAAKYMWEFMLFLVFLLDLSIGHKAFVRLLTQGRPIEFILLRCFFWGCYTAGPVLHKRNYQRWPRVTRLGWLTLFLIVLCGSFDVLALFKKLSQ